MKLIFVPLITLLALVSCATSDKAAKPRLAQVVKYEGTRSGSLVEGRRTVTGKVTVDRSDKNCPKLHVLASDGRSMSGALPARAVLQVEAEQVYDVELLTRVYTAPDYVFDDVLRVKLNERVLYDASVCSLHHVAMLRVLEDETDACLYPDSFFPLQEKRFPNDGNAYLACGSGIRHPTWKCPKCDRLYQVWCRRYGIR